MSTPVPFKFAAVARRIARERAGGASAVVDCGTCTMCCREPQRVALIAAELVNPLLRHDGKHLLRQPDGSCTHLVDGRCEIYAQRPRSCRTFDCRALAVAMCKARSAPGVTRASYRRVAPPCDAEDVAYATAVHKNLLRIVARLPGVDAVDAGCAAVGVTEHEVALERHELLAMSPDARAEWIAEQVGIAAGLWCEVSNGEG
jgi:Putative zinc- or iron-chelating domain